MTVVISKCSYVRAAAKQNLIISHNAHNFGAKIFSLSIIAIRARDKVNTLDTLDDQHRIDSRTYFIHSFDNIVPFRKGNQNQK